MFRRELASERIQRIDQKTGIKVIQLTSYPTPSVHLMYDWPSITSDNSRIVILCQRSAAREAPWDLFRCDTDGLNLFQLTDRDPSVTGSTHYGYSAPPSAYLSLDGRSVYTIWPGEDALFTVNCDTGKTEFLCDLSGYTEGGAVAGIQQTLDGKHLYVGLSQYGEGEGSGLKIDPSSGAVERLDLGGLLWGLIKSTGRLVVVKNFMTLGSRKREDGIAVYTNLNEEPVQMYTVNQDSTDEKYLCPMIFAHATTMGLTDRIQGTGLPPDRCIWTVRDGEEPQKIAEGPYFWHSGPSFDGEWIVSDTNWPDDGLHLIHTPTGNHRTLCFANATQEHTQFGHPHPALSRDGRLAVFGSDRTGVPQVYIAHIPDEFRESLIEGDLDHPKPKWL